MAVILAMVVAAAAATSRAELHARARHAAVASVRVLQSGQSSRADLSVSAHLRTKDGTRALRCAATIAAGDRHRTSVMKFVATNQCFLVLLAIRSRTHKKVLRQRHPARRTFAILEGERAYHDVSNCARGHAPHPWAPYSNAITQQRAHLSTASHSGVHERRRPT